jgi:hypothetical protein
MTGDEGLVPVFIPALAPLLLRAEQLKGSPLTEAEVLRVRDAAKCVMMRPEEAQSIEEGRGYQDIDPENCWAEWQRLRLEVSESKAEDGGA